MDQAKIGQFLKSLRKEKGITQEEFAEKVDTPILAGGLIEFEEEVDNAIDAGAKAVSTANKKLWNYK